MTENEAIEELKYDCNELGKAIPCDTGWGVAINSAYDMAVKALEKQIGENPYWREEEGAQGYACPCCDMGVVDVNGIRDTYCHSCGQRLNWSDID